MKIAIIGAGNIGGTLGRHWVRAGHEVFFGMRRPESARALLDELGPLARSGSVDEGVRSGSVLVFAAPYGAWPEFARLYANSLVGKTVVDTANPYAARDGELATSIAASGGGSGSYTAHLLPGAHVVKAFNTVYWMDLRDQANRQGELLAMPIAGDDGLAVELATQLAQSAGFEPVLVGALARSAELDPGSPIYAKSMTAAQVRSTLKISSDSNK